MDKNCFLYDHMKDAAVKNTTSVDLFPKVEECQESKRNSVN